MCEVSALTHLLLEPEYEYYLFFDHTEADFEYGLDSTFTDLIKALKLDIAFDQPDPMAYLVSLRVSVPG